MNTEISLILEIAIRGFLRTKLVIKIQVFLSLLGRGRIEGKSSKSFITTVKGILLVNISLYSQHNTHEPFSEVLDLNTPISRTKVKANS